MKRTVAHCWSSKSAAATLLLGLDTCSHTLLQSQRILYVMLPSSSFCQCWRTVIQTYSVAPMHLRMENLLPLHAYRLQWLTTIARLLKLDSEYINTHYQIWQKMVSSPVDLQLYNQRRSRKMEDGEKKRMCIFPSYESSLQNSIRNYVSAVTPLIFPENIYSMMIINVRIAMQ